MHKYLLELIVFTSGAAVMILELTASRILAPYIGTSLYSWSSIIGIMLGSLSIGYWIGGSISDKKPTITTLSLIIFCSSLWIGLLSFSKDIVLLPLTDIFVDVRISSFVATIALFSITTIFLGMVSPYATTLKIESIKNSGQTIGKLYAIATIGSIVGTFLTGFFLITYLGNTKILIFLCGMLLCTSLLASLQSLRFKLLIFAAVAMLFFLPKTTPNNITYTKETPYNSVRVVPGIDPQTQNPITILKIGTEFHSAMFLHSEALVFDYTKYYDLAKHFVPNLSTALMIGGGAYSYPKHFVQTYDDATLDVVEIDPYLTTIAKDYFKLTENKKLTIIHEDGRTYIKRRNKTYDAILIDAFSSYISVPYHLTTQEATRDIFRLLEPDGVVIMNIISSLKGDKAKFFQAEYHTYQSVFSSVYVFPVQSTNPTQVQNIILVAIKSKNKPFAENNDDKKIQEMLKKRWDKAVDTMPILTNDHAPVDQYIAEFL